ncbi:PREDICTED: putative polyketide hydroxylase [Nicrophorus vespilloides]|uniref:Polyketide hydroxylase n=1 Tax=Nicrophorus vespilloides TaxID=110193 RepID=A0ABM1NA49_NICVS|nr:PREDICTED: putative polyketide hydroxylase [Nicrophorus vespilloides]
MHSTATLSNMKYFVAIVVLLAIWCEFGASKPSGGIDTGNVGIPNGGHLGFVGKAGANGQDGPNGGSPSGGPSGPPPRGPPPRGGGLISAFNGNNKANCRRQNATTAAPTTAASG